MCVPVCPWAYFLILNLNLDAERVTMHAHNAWALSGGTEGMGMCHLGVWGVRQMSIVGEGTGVSHIVGKLLFTKIRIWHSNGAHA